MHHNRGRGAMDGRVQVMGEVLHLYGFRKEVTMLSPRFELAVLRREAKSPYQQAKGDDRKELSNFFQLPQSKISITFHTMFRRICPFLLLLSVVSAYAQEPAKAPNALH